MNLVFISYEVTDVGVEFTFDLPVGVQSTIQMPVTVTLTDAELAAISTPAQLRMALTNKLQRKVNRLGIASKLDNFIGQTITI